MRLLSLALAGISALAAAGSASAERFRAESAHIIVEADGPPDSVARYAWELEQLHGLLETMTGARTPSTSLKFRLFVLDDVTTLRSLVPMPEGTGAFYAGNDYDELAAIGLQDKQRIFSSKYDYRWALYHEYCHYFMMHYMGQLQPGWFIEGFASVCESVDLSKEGTITYGAQPLIRTLEPRARWIPLRDLLTGLPDRPDVAWNAQFYAQGWLLSHFYYFANSSRRAELDAYFTKVRSGENVSDADSIFTGGLAGLESDVLAYHAQGNFQVRGAALSGVPASSIKVEPVSPGEEELATTRIRAIAIHEYSDLRVIAEAGLPIARKYPSDAKVVEYVAWMAFESGDYATAEKLIEPFIATTQSPRTLALQGLVITRHALDEADVDDFNPMVRRGRAFIDRAMKLAPRDPLVMNSMYRSLEAEIGPTPPEAFDLLAREIDITPANTGLRFRLADALVSNKQYKRAIDALRPLANSPHEGQARYRAAAYITQIERQLQ